MKEYKVSLKEIESMTEQGAIDYIEKREAKFKELAKAEADKKTDDYDAPVREYWSYMAAANAMVTLLAQLTGTDRKEL